MSGPYNPLIFIALAISLSGKVVHQKKIVTLMSNLYLMQPNISKVVIDDNLKKVEAFIQEVIIAPKKTMKHWSMITNQTPAVKLGYVGQHLASLITGVQGTGSGARGDDLIDGTEVKSCNKIDQVDKCKECGAHVMRYEQVCPECGSTKIDRKDDSKWLFSVRDEHELHQYLTLDRILLILMDYPNFDDGDYRDVRISAFEIYPKEERMQVFGRLIRNHYYNIYLPKITGKLREGLTKGNPMNLHPFSFQFYKCNPIKVFQCVIKDIDNAASIQIDAEDYVSPKQERGADMPSLLMPSTILKDEEWSALINGADFDREILPKLSYKMSKEWFRNTSKKQKQNLLPFIDESLREYIPLREIKAVLQKEHYQR